MSLTINTAADMTDVWAGSGVMLPAEPMPEAEAAAEPEIASAAEEANEPAAAEPEAAAVATEATDTAAAAATEIESDDPFWREVEVIARLAEVERKRQWLSMQFDLLSEERKECKEKLDHAVIELQMAASELVTLASEQGIFGRNVFGVAQLPNAESVSTEAAAGASTEPNWRATKTSELLAGLRGLGTKKLEAISDIAPTAGELEDLRARASAEHKQFHEVLPQGCGQTLAGNIENRLIEHVAKYGTPRAADQVEPRVESPAPDAEPTAAAEPVTEAAAEPVSEETGAEQPAAAADGDDSEPSDAIKAATADEGYVDVLDRDDIDQMLGVIRLAISEANWTIAQCEAKGRNGVSAESGYLAAKIGEDAYAVLDNPEGMQINEWLTGWACWERVETLQAAALPANDLASL